MSRHNKDKGRIEGPFVPMLIPTMESAAWKAMSPYARVVYYTLKSRYGHKIKNNGRIWLAVRDGAKETGFDRNRIARSLRELAHYGFIVATKGHCLGLDGKGTATHWRLTELGYMHDPPTRDFLKWDGEMFHEQKSPEYYKRRERRLAKLKDSQKQNPVRASLTGCQSITDITVSGHDGQLPAKVSGHNGHVSEVACQSTTDISRVNHSPASVSDSASVPVPVPDNPWPVYRSMRGLWHEEIYLGAIVKLCRDAVAGAVMADMRERRFATGEGYLIETGASEARRQTPD